VRGSHPAGLIADVQQASLPEDRMTLPEFLAVASPLAIPTIVEWLSSYVLLVVAARLLDAGEFGAAAASVALFLVFDAWNGAMQRRKWALLVDVGMSSLVFAVALPVVTALFHVGWGPLALLIPAVVASRVKNFQRRQSRGGRPASGGPILSGATRVLVGIGLVAGGLGLIGIVLAMLAGELAALLEPLMRPSVSNPNRIGPPDQVPVNASGPIAVAATVTMAAFAHADLLLARHFLSRAASGEYAAAAIVARSLVFIPVIVTWALWTGAVRVRSDEPFRWFRQWVATAAAGVLVAGAALALLRDPILRGLLGGKAAPVQEGFSLIVAGVALVAIVWQLSSFHLVVDSRAYFLTMVGLVAEVLAVAFMPATDDRIAAAVLVAAGVTAILQYQAGWAITRWSPPLSLLRPHEELLDDTAAAEPLQGIQLSIIVPCHNAGPGLRDFLARLESELSALGSYEIVLVSDGSTDDTLAIARELASTTLRVVHYPERSGKGHALRVGLSRARGAYIGFIDSDGDIDPQAIGPFLSLMSLYQPDVVLGSKRHPMSEVAYPPLRRVMSWVYHKLTRLLFRVNVRDTQTGLKVIRRDVLSAVLPRMFEKRYAWDLELLVVARMLGFTRVFEAPVRIQYRFSSQVDPNAAFRIILDSVAIFYRRFILNSYRHTAHRLAVIRDQQASA
jgi:Glycosyl transferase family 2